MAGNDIVPATYASGGKRAFLIDTARQFSPTEPIGVLGILGASATGVVAYTAVGTWALLIVAIMLPVLIFGALITAAVERSSARQRTDEKRQKTTARHLSCLAGNVYEMLGDGEPEPSRRIKKRAPTEDTRRRDFVTKVIEGKQHPDIVGRLADGIGRLHDRWHQARKELDPEIAASEIKAIAVEARAAARKLVDDAMQQHALTQEERREKMRNIGTDVVTGFSADARAIAGNGGAMPALPPPSTTAALGRLTAIAERALEQDPDLADGQGARIDALVRKHLPRLAQRHADAAKGSADLHEVDAMLDAGVEEARASIEDALANDGDRRFDALREEVAFLRARRGADTL